MADRFRYRRDPAHPKPPRWGRLYDRFFPRHTDPCSRHAKAITQSLRQQSELRRLLIDAGYDVDHMASSIEATIVALWKERARNAG